MMHFIFILIFSLLHSDYAVVLFFACEIVFVFYLDCDALFKIKCCGTTFITVSFSRLSVACFYPGCLMFSHEWI